MAHLSAAHYGYHHQDVVTAYALATLLLPRSDDRTATIDKKAVDGDCFDDLELAGHRRRRTQIKAHETKSRPLRLTDFTTDAISFRIDNAIRSVVDDTTPAREYRLFTTCFGPEEDLLHFLEPTPSVLPLLPGLTTQRFRLNSDRIWPEGQPPAWPHLEGLERETLAEFCNRFVIELGCPPSSGDLRSPGPLEKALLDLLHHQIGVGFWPNDNRVLADAAALLIHTAIFARKASSTLDQEAVKKSLDLRIDYGRIEECFPVDQRRLVSRTETINEIVANLHRSPRLALTGSPGFGKSWILNELASRLATEGWIVAVHYCFVDLFDLERGRRASVETMFGSVMAELYDVDPTLATNAVPRYAAGHRELERLLENATQEKPDRRIVIIVDGLDHADRVPERSSPHAAADIAEELASLSLPPGVILIVGSQPGDHLQAFLEVGGEYRVSRWPRQPIRLLAERMDVPRALHEGGLDGDINRVLDTIVEKADGSPLYATYLARTTKALAWHEASTPAEVDIPEYLSNVPKIDEDLDRYYEWLVGSFGGESAVLWIGELLSLLDFSVSADELGEILPYFRHHVSAVLSRLVPVLSEDVARGGVRIHHESFQRYMRRRLESDSTETIPNVLAPAITWLDARGFFADVRAFRSLLSLLRIAGRDNEVVARITDDFVAQAAAHCQPADAVLANLATAGAAAATLQDWTALARLVEVSRAADYLYDWRLTDNELAEQYGRAYAAQFGAKELSNRLLHDGRCTFPPRPGLILCQLCDQRGAIPPWKEYRSAHDRQRRTSNTSYGQESETAVNGARLRGRLRLKGRERSIRECTDWLTLPDSLQVHPADAAFVLGEMYGTDTLATVITSLPPGKERAWARLVLAELVENPQEARAQANAAVEDGLPQDGWRTCLRAGADPAMFSLDLAQLHELTVKVISPGAEHKPELLLQWLAEIELAAVVGDETALTGIQACIPSDTWFRRWLRFCVTIARRSLTQDELASCLRDLSENIEVFKGSPRVCDLYQLHGDVQRSFREALTCLDDAHWGDAIHALAQISTGTSTWLTRSRTGPLPLDALFELCLATANTHAKLLAASTLAAELLAPGRRTHELYDTNALDHLLLARIHARSGQHDLAEKAWLEACTYLVAYGYRKDITVYELLDPLKALACANSQQVRQCFRDVQPVVERILTHTDGRETNHAIHAWLDHAARIHPAGALSYIAHDEIERVPSFGDLDHALPQALLTLEGNLDVVQVAAGWMAAGTEARSEPHAALLACEKLICTNSQLGRCIWNLLVAVFDGDGVGPAEGLTELTVESAQRVGLPVPPVTAASSSEDKKGHEISGSALKAQEVPLYIPPVLPATASPLQIAHSVRRWRETHSPKADSESVVNAVGWRLLEMIQAGDEVSAEALLRRLARDTPASWDPENFLSGLAEGLASRCQPKLAALARAFASTRTLDGWGRLGRESEQLFLPALSLDPSTAWSVQADEVAESVACGGGYGVTAHLIKLLAAGGRPEEAFAAWDAACRAVTFRVPLTGPRDESDPVYDHQCEVPSDMLAATVVARINHCLVHEKRLAIAAVALMASHCPLSLAAALRVAITQNAPPSTLITLLHIMERFERAPYEATQAVAADLRTVGRGDLVSARVLSSQLLERTGLAIPSSPPSSPPVVSTISDTRTAELIRLIGTRWVEAIEEIWPDFGRHVAGRVDSLLKTEDLRERMQRAVSRIGTHRKGRRLRVWLPIDEEVVRTVQITGAAVRGVLAQQGILDDGLEDEVGTRLLGDLDISIRHTFSRSVRPIDFPFPTSLAQGSFTSEPRIVQSGEFAGWVIIAHDETELVIDEKYPKPVVERLTVYSGITFVRAWRDGTDLPLGVGNPSVWCSRPLSAGGPDPFRGPLAGLEFVADLFGPLEILTPPPIVLNTHRLVPAPFYRGLTLVDASGEAAAVCRTWRQRFIGDKQVADQEHCLEGLQLLLRPDIFEAVSALAIEPATYVTVVSRNRTDDGNSDDE